MTNVTPTADSSLATASADAPTVAVPVSTRPAVPAAELEKRWRLILGGESQSAFECALTTEQQAMDAALEALYGSSGINDDEEDGGQGGRSRKRSGGLGASSPRAARWLGDIRTYFPSSVVQVMQKDAVERLGLRRMLLEPEMLQAVTPDVHLVSTLVSLGGSIPEKTKATARAVVRKVVEEIERKLSNPMRQAITGALSRSVRNNRPRHAEIDWPRTIRANMKHYQVEYKTIVPERRIGFGRKSSALKDIILCVDQSGSMATSVVYSSILAAVMATIRAVRTSLVVFDTAVVDLTDELKDPVDVIFGTQLGGGTDINRALAYCESLVRTPGDTILILISDLIEGGNQEQMLSRAAAMVQSGVTMIALLALSDDGAPCFDKKAASILATLGVPSFACTPDKFPDLMAAALRKDDVMQWAAKEGIVTARAG
ncbi:MAG: VWA domain-containing protein [Candidatus Methylacidiphilales bacterium]|nr:VWA domain-containing protein [Candidatus Methylacidiphilales bacterium]